ncbi:MAG TPA: hypothetical protein VF783_14900, partial [Terriglobales bacterium]
PPWLNDVQRPDPRLGTINFLESAATSIYKGLTLLLKGQVGQQLFIRTGCTLAKTIDDARVSKAFQRSERVRLTLQAELFNVTLGEIAGSTFPMIDSINSAGQFVAYSTQVAKSLYSGEFVKNSPGPDSH